MTMAKGKTFEEYKRKATRNAFMVAIGQFIVILVAYSLVMTVITKFAG